MYRKNVFTKDVLRAEMREAGLGLAIAILFICPIAYTPVYWAMYGEDFGLQDAVITIFKILLIWLYAGSAVFYGTAYAIERGKLAWYYYGRLSEHRAIAQGCR